MSIVNILISIPLRNQILETATKEEIYAAYDTSAYNCYITGKISIRRFSEPFWIWYLAAMYAVVIVFSGWQVAVNNSRSYQMI